MNPIWQGGCSGLRLRASPFCGAPEARGPSRPAIPGPGLGEATVAHCRNQARILSAYLHEEANEWWKLYMKTERVFTTSWTFVQRWRKTWTQMNVLCEEISPHQPNGVGRVWSQSGVQPLHFGWCSVGGGGRSHRPDRGVESKPSRQSWENWSLALVEWPEASNTLTPWRAAKNTKVVCLLVLPRGTELWTSACRGVRLFRVSRTTSVLGASWEPAWDCHERKFTAVPTDAFQFCSFSCCSSIMETESDFFGVGITQGLERSQFKLRHAAKILSVHVERKQ